MSDSEHYVPTSLPEISQETLDLYARLIKLQKQRVRIQAEIDNVRELIRQKGL